MSWLIPERFSDSFCRRHGWWVLLALTALLYLPGLGTLPLMDRDEPRFAHATVEMMQRGVWLVPYFNSDPAMSDAERIAAMRKGKGAMEVGYRFDKPPLTYWWMRLHYWLFGLNEFAARFHTVVATWLVALVTFAIGLRLAGARVGLAAGIAWLTTLQVVVHGRLCVADMPMVLCVTLTCWALIELLLMSPRSAHSADEGSEIPLTSHLSPLTFNKWHWLLYVSLGLGFLAKGPVAWLMPGFALALWRFAFWRKPVAWSHLKLWPGSLIALGIVAAWGIPALLETQGLFWKVGMGEHVVDRGTKAFNGRFPIPGYYLVSALLSLFPWIMLLPQVWQRVRAQWNLQFAFLVSWLLAPYVIFSLYATQLPHYVMPGFPAAVLLLMSVGEPGKPGKWAWGLCAGFGLMAFGLAFACMFMPQVPLGVKAIIRDAAGFLLQVSAFGGCLLMLLARTRLSFFRHRAVLLILIFGASASIARLGWHLRQVHPAVQLADKVLPLPEQMDLVGWQFQEPSLVFHFNHHWKFMNKLAQVDERMQRPGARMVVLLRREWTVSRVIKGKCSGKKMIATEQDFSNEVDTLMGKHQDYRVLRFSGLNAARSSWVELRLLVRR